MTNVQQKIIRRALSCALMVLGAWGFQTNAQSWPAKPIVFVTAGAPGDGLDLITRVFAQSMNKSLGQTIVVDNRPGGGEKSPWSTSKMPTPTGTPWVSCL